MEGLGQGGQDTEKVHWVQNGHSRQELCVVRLDSQLPRQWRRVDQYVRRNFHNRSLACNNIHYPTYVQSLASLPALTPVPTILYSLQAQKPATGCTAIHVVSLPRQFILLLFLVPLFLPVGRSQSLTADNA